MKRSNSNIGHTVIKTHNQHFYNRSHLLKNVGNTLRVHETQY